MAICYSFCIDSGFRLLHLFPYHQLIFIIISFVQKQNIIPLLQLIHRSLFIYYLFGYKSDCLFFFFFFEFFIVRFAWRI